MKNENSNEQVSDLASSGTSKISKTTNRRKVLKTTVAVGGVAATTVWHKPVIKTIALPAHAMTSETTGTDDNNSSGNDVVERPVFLAGPTSGQPSVAMQSNDNNSIAQKMIDAVVPMARAGTNSLTTVSSAFINGGNGNNYQHCVSLSLPTNINPTSVDVTLSGPTVYVGYTQYNPGYYSPNSAYYEYYYSENYSGSASGALTENGDDFDFSVMIGDIEICGTIDASLTSANGELFLTAVSCGGACSLNDVFSPQYGAFMSNPFIANGYGAYWGAIDGNSCAIGGGPDQTSMVTGFNYQIP